MPEGSDNPNEAPRSGSPSVATTVVDLPQPSQPGNLHSPYTPAIAENVAALFSEGMPLAKIGRLPDMPSTPTLYRWCFKHPEFRQLLDSARMARAIQDEDEARAALEEDDPDRASLARMKFDGHMQLAAVNDPSRYGKKTTVQGDETKPIRFVIQTGVPAPLPEKEVIAEVAETLAEVAETLAEVAPDSQPETEAVSGAV